MYTKIETAIKMKQQQILHVHAIWFPCEDFFQETTHGKQCSSSENLVILLPRNLRRDTILQLSLDWFKGKFTGLSPIFNGKIPMVSCKISLNPIQS